MTRTNKNSLKKVSVYSLIAGLIATLLLLVGYFQTQHQLVSPLIPDSIITKLSKPYLSMTIISSIILAIGLLLYRKGLYILTIIICSIVIVGPRLYIEFSG